MLLRDCAIVKEKVTASYKLIVMSKHGAFMKKLLLFCFLFLNLRAMLVRYLADGSREHEVAMVDVLLKMGESVNQVDNVLRRSVLGWATRTGDVDIVRRVLVDKPVIDIADSDGRTPLMLAAFGDFENGSYEDIVMLLLSAGVAIGRVDNYGKTALDYALMPRKKNAAVINRLLVVYANDRHYSYAIEQWQKRMGMLK